MRENTLNDTWDDICENTAREPSPRWATLAELWQVNPDAAREFESLVPELELDPLGFKFKSQQRHFCIYESVTLCAYEPDDHVAIIAARIGDTWRI